MDIVIRGGYIYVAQRDESGDCQGTIEVTRDLTEKRKIEGERRLLNYYEREPPGPRAGKYTEEGVEQ